MNSTYQRDDGVVMVELRPGQFVNEAVAERLGIKTPGRRKERPRRLQATERPNTRDTK
jgi:hypothetical protein